jgi:hypothetical protein
MPASPLGLTKPAAKKHTPPLPVNHHKGFSNPLATDTYRAFSSEVIPLSMPTLPWVGS